MGYGYRLKGRTSKEELEYSINTFGKREEDTFYKFSEIYNKANLPIKIESFEHLSGYQLEENYTIDKGDCMCKFSYESIIFPRLIEIKVNDKGDTISLKDKETDKWIRGNIPVLYIHIDDKGNITKVTFFFRDELEEMAKRPKEHFLHFPGPIPSEKPWGWITQHKNRTCWTDGNLKDDGTYNLINSAVKRIIKLKQKIVNTEDSKLFDSIKNVFSENSEVVKKCLSSPTKRDYIYNFIMNKVMKINKGHVDPKIAKEYVEKKIQYMYKHSLDLS